MSGKGNPMYGKNIKEFMSPEDYAIWKKHITERDMSGKNNPFYGKHHSEKTRKLISDKNKEYVKIHGHGSSYGKKHSAEWRKRNSESHKHKYSPERKLKQTRTVINKCCGKLCNLSEFDF